MNGLTLYIVKEVIKGSLIAGLVLLTLLDFFTFADELGDLGQGDYRFKQIFSYLALTSPRNFYELMPSAALLGSLVSLGALANNRELVAMQAAGFSRPQIIGSVLLGGLVLSVVSVGIGEYIAPPAERAAQNLKSAAMNKQTASQTKYGFWVRDGNVFINIRQIQRPEDLGDISIYELGEGQTLREFSHARRATYDAHHWDLQRIRLSRFDGRGVSSERKESADWSSVLAPDLLNAFVVRPENLSALELSRYIGYLRENGQRSLVVEQAFWGRMVNPAVTLVMMLVATPFVLQVRREVGSGQRIVVGVVIGLGFYLFDKMFNHLGLIYEMNPVFASAFPTSLAFLAAVFALVRTGSN